MWDAESGMTDTWQFQFLIGKLTTRPGGTGWTAQNPGFNPS